MASAVCEPDSTRASRRRQLHPQHRWQLQPRESDEVASIGTESVLRTWTADAAIVTEPTGLEVCIAHKGFVAFELETIGRAAHGSRPDLGIDAIAKMGHVLVGLDELDRTLRANPLHELLGSGSLHASVISGGQEYSSYPERCVLQAERRTLPGE